MTNSELMARLPMAVCEGASIGIRVESVGLRIAFVGGAVVALDFEKQILHFPQRAAVNGGGEFFHRARELGFATAQAAAKQNSRCVLR